jgi:hypothetical protein
MKTFVEAGVQEQKVESVGYGFSRPLDTKSTPEAWEKNRRTEIEFFGVKDRNQLNKLLEQIFGSGTGAAMTDAEIDAYNVDTDWVDYFFRPATTMSHDLSIEKSGQKVNNYTSFGYLEQSGILRTTGLKRFAVRNNFSGRSENDKLKYYINTAVTHSKNNEATNLGSGSINRNYVTGAFLGAPYLRPSDYAGSEWAYNYYNNSPGLLATPYLLSYHNLLIYPLTYMG